MVSPLPPPSSTPIDGQRPARSIPVAITERPCRPVMESLLGGVSLVAKVLLCVGVGAIVLVWETIGKLLQPMQESITIGPGKPTAAPPAAPLQSAIKVPIVPIDDYSRLGEEEVIRRLNDLTEMQLLVIGDFERAHRGRPRILQEIDRMLAAR